MVLIGDGWDFLEWLVLDPDGWEGRNIKEETPQWIMEQYWAWVKKEKARYEEAYSKNEFPDIY